MLERKYTVIFEPDESGGYVVRVPALPGCTTQGDTLEEAREMVKDAIQGYIECLLERNIPIPEEKEQAVPFIERFAILV
ncbi:type II toxin-antitoxin system HicB family antitoxin [bacterium]|nr:type II toxin-antitoxin system HicB family antitoxin [FCB group bacterium]MBL7190477.1 type II toxin-antitoxin system HicB family antitoxin [bacterium]